MIMWDKSEHEYIKVYDFIDFSEELLGVTRDEGEAQVISWLENSEITVRLYINFKGYTLIDQAENTPYQIYTQCNYIHAWIKLLGFARRNLLRKLKDKTSDLNLDYVNTGRGFLDKIMISKPIATKYLPQELEPIDPIELKEKQKVVLGSDKPFSNDFSMILNTTAVTELKNLYFKKDELLKIFSPSSIEENRDQQIIRLSGENRFLKDKLESKDKRIASLESQLVQTKNEPSDKPADDLKDVPHQSYRTVDRVMYAMAKLTNLDNTEPYSQNNPSLNASITTLLQNDGLTLEYQAVGKWLSRINDIKPLK